jgi:hypothetical protein
VDRRFVTLRFRRCGRWGRKALYLVSEIASSPIVWHPAIGTQLKFCPRTTEESCTVYPSRPDSKANEQEGEGILRGSPA